MPRAELINYTFLTNCCAKHFLLHFPNQHKCTLVFIMTYYCQILVINHNSNISLVCGKVNAGFHLKHPPHKLRDCLKTKNPGIIWGKTNRSIPMTTPKRYELEDAQWDRIKGYFPPIPDWPSIKPRQPYRPQRYPLAHAQRGSLAWSTSLWLLENGV